MMKMMIPKTYPILDIVNGIVKIPEPITVFTIVMVVKKKSEVGRESTSFYVIEGAGKDASLTLLVAAEVVGMDICVLVVLSHQI